MLEAVFWRVLTTACVVSAFLAVLLFPARRWMLRRCAPQVRWGLWLGLGAVLILGVFVSGFTAVPQTQWDVPAYSVTLPAAPAYRSQRSGGEPAALPETTEPPASAETEPYAPASGSGAQAPETASRREVTVSAASAAGAVWLTGAAVVLLWPGVRYGRTRRRLLAASVPTGDYDTLVREMDVRADVRILPGLACPMALGVLRPVILLPEGKVPPLAVRHELTHLRRHDLAGKALLLAACALYWFDPLVWRMARTAGEDMETACDAQITRHMTPAEKRAYGELLLAAASGGRAAPLTTCFGGSGEQMRSRLTQLFRPGRAGRALTGILLAAALLATGLVACRSVPQKPEGTVYAALDLAVQPEDTDYRELTLDLVDFAPGADWVGGSYETVTLPVSEQVRISGRAVSGEWKKDLLSFLAWPQLRAYFFPGTDDVLRLQVEDGVITAMDWFEGVETVGGVLWQDADYGAYFPCVLRLPDSWRDGFDTVAALSRKGEDHVTDYSVEFYRKGTRELLFTLEALETGTFRAQYGYDDDALAAQGIWLLGEGGGWCFCGEIAPSAAPEDAMVRDLTDQFGQACLAWLGPETYTSARYGFTLTLPDSWQGHYTVGETHQGVEFYYGDRRLTLDILPESMAAEEDPSRLLGSGNGWNVYAAVSRDDAAEQTEDMNSHIRQIRGELMHRDLTEWMESGTWGPVFAQGEDAVYPALPPEAELDGAARTAFAAALRNLRENGILPDGRAAEGPDSGAGEANSFAVADVDGDGKEELVLYYTTASMAGMSGYVAGYDEESGRLRIQLVDFPSLEFYGSGAVKAMLSHNQSLGELWPYVLYTYLPQTDTYRQETTVMAWDKDRRATGEHGEPFPEEVDRSGAGTVYYVGSGWYEGEPMDEADYLAWEQEALEGSAQLTLRFYALTEESIAAMEYGETP